MRHCSYGLSILLIIFFEVKAVSAVIYESFSSEPAAILIPMLLDSCATPITNEAMPAMPVECSTQLFSQSSTVEHKNLPKRIKDWGSNGLGGRPWQFSASLCNNFFIELLERIAHLSSGVKLSPHDLFHGHLIGYGANGKQKNRLAVVFHAKEYPSDLEEVKNRYQIPTEKFMSTDESFAKRNFLYMPNLSAIDHNLMNQIYLIEDSGRCSAYFSREGVNTLSETALADALLNGALLGDVNVFLPQNIGRIKYRFYDAQDMETHNVIKDYERRQSGKSMSERIIANELLDSWIILEKNRPIIYFLTGR